MVTVKSIEPLIVFTIDPLMSLTLIVATSSVLYVPMKPAVLV